MFNILVIEDDLKLRQLFCTVLEKNKYNTYSAGNGLAAFDILEKEFIDLIISDIMMPEMDGYEFVKNLRRYNQSLPVLMVTAKDAFADKEQGFLAGTDDYMVKPIDVNEMVLRVGALLRRAQIINQKKILCGNTVLDYDALTVTWQGQSCLLPQKEFYLLYKLLSYSGKIFTRQQLMDEIWGLESESDERTVDVHINRLRERFSQSEDFQIITVRGLGYKAVKL